jgi:hypothetical protein
MMKSELLAEYRPYNSMQAFHDGWNDYEAGHYLCPFRRDSVEAQAWDRGQNAAMRWLRRNQPNRGD